MKLFFLIVIAASYGILSSAGVFTALAAVGLVPRFAGRTHTVSHALLYERMVVRGAISGCLVSVFPEFFCFGEWWKRCFPNLELTGTVLAYGIQIAFGLGAGMFVGCLALSIAEMLDSIPILSRRIGFKRGLSFAVFGMALGKLIGSLIYFSTSFGSWY